jgi:hypothetical protein
MNTSSARHVSTIDPGEDRGASVRDAVLATQIDCLQERHQARLAPYTRTYFRTSDLDRQPIRFAILDAAQYDAGLERELRRHNYHGVAIREPTDWEIERLPDFHLAPEWIRWVMPAPQTVDAWIDGIGNSDAKNQLRRKLRASHGIRAEVAPLNLHDYRRWRERLYVPEILSRPGAIPAWQEMEQFALNNSVPTTEPLAERHVPGFIRVFYFDAADDLVGGVLLFADDAERTIRVRAAAFEARSRASHELAIRSMALLVEEARARAFATLSYGDDINLYGVDVGVGLERFKASVGMNPVPSSGVPFQLFKVFGDSLRQLRAGAPEGTYPGILAFAVAGAGTDRVAAYHRTRAALDGDPGYERRIELMRANAVGVQIGGDPAAAAIRIPRGMRLLRVPAAD